MGKDIHIVPEIFLKKGTLKTIFYMGTELFTIRGEIKSSREVSCMERRMAKVLNSLKKAK